MDLGAHGFSLRLGEASQGLLDRFGIRIDIEGVLSEFPGDAWHIGWLTSVYFPALTEELDVRAFLCLSEALQHVDGLVLILRVNMLCLCLLSWAEFIGY